MYGYLLPHLNGSDLCTVLIIVIDLSTRVATVWHQGKARINRHLQSGPPGTHIPHESTCRVPHEIVEVILAHFTDDIPTLKACSFTCRSWYTTAHPYLHHTLTLGGNGPYITRGRLKPLYKLHELGLIPLVKEIRVRQGVGREAWFAPRAFNRHDLQYFSAFANVQTLVLQCLQIYRFIPGIERYFEQFSPTLQSIVLSNLHCTRRQLLYFLSLFPNLDDIEIRHALAPQRVDDSGLIPLSAPKLRGQLVLHYFLWTETWTDLIALCGGLRFRYMNLRGSHYCTPILLEGCAETLETLRLSNTYDLASK